MLPWKTRFYRLCGSYRSNRYVGIFFSVKLTKNEKIDRCFIDGVVLVDPRIC